MLDEALVSAINDVAADMGQPTSVAQRLIAWLSQLSDGEPTREEELQFLDNVRKALVVGESNHAD